MKNTDHPAGRFRGRFLLLFGGKKKGTRPSSGRRGRDSRQWSEGAARAERQAIEESGAGNQAARKRAHNGRRGAHKTSGRGADATALPVGGFEGVSVRNLGGSVADAHDDETRKPERVRPSTPRLARLRRLRSNTGRELPSA